ncbi:Uncharacterized conserved protein YbjT, contains NAD(P)-binding and DUF2867 domains [Pseudonocardia thermophila]|jgi:Predicted nucleoside-diphosphate-sugar epimerases|uniref:Uncharacterized conserved protein YbjT, contains NAD(P)-binding and DUF2867 domains n=1 Tax=Pseudonocardia thermophila TaxID=1848 RepID=A0A1M6TQ55_PSETH|nr:NAD(P)H-binding protein [Pseudonocardia thermophila]SHK59050.1 Uncharacterized conserved protein YbjT, contains NAD(P)-binding and DUF2867 domains [Pseudonocardia thermophila]
MKVVVVGSSGLVGRGLVERLTAAGYEVVAASRSSGVDAVTGEGVAAALVGAHTVVDATNAPTHDPAEMLRFFTTATTNLLAAERTAGVRHHVLVSVVGADGLPDNGHLTAKAAAEQLVRESGVPFTILRATQFYEFLTTIADSCTAGDTVTLPDAQLQPVAVADVQAALARIATGEPANRILDMAGPDRRPLAEFVIEALAAQNASRTVVTSDDARFFGAKVAAESLVPAGTADITGPTRFESWLTR